MNDLTGASQPPHTDRTTRTRTVETMTTTAALPRTRPIPLGPGPVLDVVVPVHNEQADLEPSIRRLYGHLTQHFPYPFRITIADNASVDATPMVAESLAAELPEVTSVRLAQKGRGRALREVWSASDAAVLAYMDVDLSTDLAALLPLVAPLLSGHSDLAIGSRLARGARVVRGAKREFISRCYNLILRSALAARFSDAQCGFKAIRADVAAQLLPLVRDTGWFFDTELLVLAQRIGLRIHEVPVDWVDDPDSRVDIMPTAIADLKGVLRLGRALFTGELPITRLRNEFGRGHLTADPPGVPRGLAGQAIRFTVIGIASTLAYLLLFVLLREAMAAQPANLIALLATAIANTAVNRRITFAIRGGRDAGKHQFQGLIVFAVGLALTSGALAMLPSTAARPLELAALVAANLLAAVVRFVLLRAWVFRAHRPAD
jgi:putative flippase GtrA